jgi:hypothetical protein
MRHSNEKPWTQTASGKAFQLLEPTPADIDFADIAYHLSHINRYAGAAGRYSVAQHSHVVMDLLPSEFKVYGLLHDAHEAYIGDATTPVVEALQWIATGPKQAYMVLKARLDGAIHRAAGCMWPPPVEVVNSVKYADTVALLTERRDLLGHSPLPWSTALNTEPSTVPIVRWESAEFDQAMWLKAFSVHTGKTVAPFVPRS